MKIASHILAYNVSRFIKPVIENIEPHVDKIYVAYPRRPFGYIADSREKKINPTNISEIRSASSSNKIEIIEGDWETDEAMRNACLQKAREEGFDWFLIQDADEFYTDSSWEGIRKYLLNNRSDDHLITTWFNFWKSSHYVLMNRYGSIKGTNAGFAIRCSSNIKFIRSRTCNYHYRKIIDYPCFHYSMVMSDEQMLEKITTWFHAPELYSRNWYQLKWLNWNESTRWLNPAYPWMWLRAISFPYAQPHFAEQFAIYHQDPSSKKGSFKEAIQDYLYDLSVQASIQKSNVKALIKSIARK